MCFCLLILVMASMIAVECTSFGTLNLMMPRCTDVGYERRFWVSCLQSCNRWLVLSVVLLCWTSIVKYPRKVFDVLLLGDQVWLVCFRLWGLRLPVFVKWLGQGIQYLLGGMVFTSALGSTFMERGLQPCLVMRCNVVCMFIWGSVTVHLTFSAVVWEWRGGYFIVTNLMLGFCGYGVEISCVCSKGKGCGWNWCFGGTGGLGYGKTAYLYWPVC